MATCKDCIHNGICGVQLEPHYLLDRAQKLMRESNNVEHECLSFKSRSRFVELPDVGDYDTVTTLDEAIDHCYQIATSTDETVCAECKAEHMRLCGWLSDLRRRIEAERALKEREENV